VRARKVREGARSYVAGDPAVTVAVELVAGLGEHHYRVVVRRADRRDRADIYPVHVRERLPRMPRTRSSRSPCP